MFSFYFLRYFRLHTLRTPLKPTKTLTTSARNICSARDSRSGKVCYLTPGIQGKNCPVPYPTLECNAVSYLKLCKPDVRGNKGTTNPAGYLESSNFRNDDSFMAMFIQKSEYSRNILHARKRRFSKSAD